MVVNSNNDYILFFLNILILIFQLYLKAEIKRLDEKIDIFSAHLFKVESKFNEQVYRIEKRIDNLDNH